MIFRCIVIIYLLFQSPIISVGYDINVDSLKTIVENTNEHNLKDQVDAYYHLASHSALNDASQLANYIEQGVALINNSDRNQLSPKDAFEYTSRFRSLAETNFEKDVTSTKESYRQKYKEELDEQRKLLEIQSLKEGNSNMSWIYFGSVLLLILVITIYQLWKRSKRQRVFNDNLRQRAAELADTNSELESANAILERLSYVASHDLKTPLNSMINFSGLLEKEAEKINNPSLLDHAKKIYASSLSIMSIIENVLEQLSENKPS